MEDAVLSVLVTLVLLRGLFWILMEIDVYSFAGSDATMSGIRLTWLADVSIVTSLFGIIVQLWYFLLGVDFLAEGE